MRCRLRVVASAWAGRPLVPSLSFAGPGGAHLAFLPRPPGMLLFGQPPPLVAATAVLSGADAPSLLLDLPADAFSAADAVAVPAASLTQLRAWAGGIALGACALRAPRRVRCLLPADAPLSAGATLELGGLFNLTAAAIILTANVTVSPTVAAWGTTLRFASPLLAAGVTTVRLSAASGGSGGSAASSSVLCLIAGTSPARDTVDCAVRFISASWAPGQDLLAELELATGTRRVVAGIVAGPTPAGNATLFALPPAGSQGVIFARLQQSLHSDAELSSLAATTGNRSAPAFAVPGASSCLRIGSNWLRCLVAGASTTATLPRVVVLAGIMNVTLTWTAVAVPSATPARVSWGARISLQAPGLYAGLAGWGVRVVAARLYAAEDSGGNAGGSADAAAQDAAAAAASLPCPGLAQPAADVLACDLRFVRSMWVGAALGAVLTVQDAAGGSPTSTSLALPPPWALPASAMTELPTVTVTTAGRWLARSGGESLTFVLPQPAWTAAEVTAAGGGLGAGALVRARVGSEPTPPCNVSAGGGDPRVVTCSAPPGSAVALPVRLELGSGALTLSATRVLSYAPPVVLRVLPDAVFVPARLPVQLPLPSEGGVLVPQIVVPTVRYDVNVTLDANAPEALVLMSDVRVGGVACGATPAATAPTVVTCPQWDPAAAAAAAGLDPRLASSPASFTLNISFVWDGELVFTSSIANSPGTTTAVLRPVLRRVSPPNVAAGAILLIEGSNLLPPPCLTAEAGSGSNVTAAIGGYYCAGAFAVPPNFLACVAPALPPVLPPGLSRAQLPVQVTSCLGASSIEPLRVSYPFVTPVVPVGGQGALPTVFVPSAGTDPWPFTASLRFSFPGRLPGTLLAAATCALSTNDSFAVLQPLERGRALSALRVRNGSMETGPLYMQVDAGSRAVELALTCRADDGDDVEALRWVMHAAYVRTQWCTRPPARAAAQASLPAWSVILAQVYPVPATAGSVSASVTAACTDLDPAAAAAAAVTLALPRVSCIVSAVTAEGSESGASVVNAESSVVPTATSSAPTAGAAVVVRFLDTQLSGVVAASVPLAVRCTMAGVQLPGELQHTILVEGCPPGFQPASGRLCVRCVDGFFSLGGNDTCTRCPSRGATCADGTIRPLPGFFRPLSQVGAPLAVTSEMHPCWNEEACTLNTTVPHLPVHGCNVASGYTGVLCGVCDAEAGFGAFGRTCRPCWPRGVGLLLLALLALCFVAALFYVALRRPQQQLAHGAAGAADAQSASIALRLLLSFVQTVASLRSIRATAGRTYASLMGFTDTVSTSPLSLGPISCVLKTSYGAQFAAICLVPILSAVGVAAAYTVAAVVRARAPDRRCNAVLAVARADVAQWFAARRYLPPLLTVASLAYMPVVSACVRALDCVDAVEGVRYLRADLSTRCDAVHGYPALAAAAVIVLILFGAGFPLLVLAVLLRASGVQLRDPAFSAAWSFIYAGYRIPPPEAPAAPPCCSYGGKLAACSTRARCPRVDRGATLVAVQASSLVAASSDDDTVRHAPDARRGCSCRGALSMGVHSQSEQRGAAWWGAVELAFKAGIAVLATLVTAELLQVALCALWIQAFIMLQLRATPFSAPLFNGLQLLSLTALLVTAILSSLLARSMEEDASVPTAAGASATTAATPAQRYTAAASLLQVSSLEAGVTVILILVNIGTMAVLGTVWLRLFVRGPMRRFARDASWQSGKGFRGNAVKARASADVAAVAASLKPVGRAGGARMRDLAMGIAQSRESVSARAAAGSDDASAFDNPMMALSARTNAAPASPRHIVPVMKADGGRICGRVSAHMQSACIDAATATGSDSVGAVASVITERQHFSPTYSDRAPS